MFETISESTGIRGRHYKVLKYLDDQCTKPRKGFNIAKKRFAKEKREFDAIDVLVGEKFIFQIEYKEDRRNETRACSYMVGFTPELGRSYKAIYRALRQVSRCEVAIVDAYNESVVIDAQPSIYSCVKPGKTGNKNGVPTHTILDRG